MTWTQHPGGELTHHICLPHFLGEDNSCLIDYESEKFPPDLIQGQKIAIDLKLPAKDHWNIASDPILPWILGDSQQQHEAKRTAQAQEERLNRAKTSQRHLLLGSLLNVRQEAVVRRSQQRWLPIGSES